MALRDLQTNLKSLRYGKDTVGGGNSGEPYVTTSINTAPGNTGGVDFTLRANTLSRVGDDLKRLNRFFNSNEGQAFRRKQNLLSRTEVKTQASGVINGGRYITKSTLLQAGANPFGTHLNKQGLNPFLDTSPSQAEANNIFDRIVNFSTPQGLPVYTSVVTNTQSKEDNRLVNLKDNKISKPSQLQRNSGFLSNLLGDGLSNVLRSINPFRNNIEDVIPRLIGNTKGTSAFKGEILRYSGGPGSALGVGQTVIKRYSDVTAYNTPEFQRYHYLLNAGQISSLSEERSKLDTTPKPDFRTELNTSGIRKNIISKSPDYTRKNIEQRVNLGNPGRRSKNVSSYTKGLGSALDKINALELYRGENVDLSLPVNDLVKFRIGVINNKNTKEKTYIHFRAFLDAFTDNYSAEWNAEQYMGRGEKFYRYGGFERQINLDWTVAAQSKEEIMIQYKKLNFLASVLAPDYTDAGYMAGNLVTLTLGGWCYEQPGFITNLNLSVPQESPWEIAINDSGNRDNKVMEVPHMVKVTGFNFTPIHNFVPKIQTLGLEGKTPAYGAERYIGLSKGDVDAYGPVYRGSPSVYAEGNYDDWTKNTTSNQTPIPESSIKNTQGTN